MIFVACSGFPVPVSRYWEEFPAVEVADTELGMPGAGTVRRWLREAPKGFAFTVLAPKTIAASGFKRSKETLEALSEIQKLAETLKAKAIVVAAPEDFKPGRTSRSALEMFVKGLPSSYPTVVLDLPAWKPQLVASIIGNKRVAVAYDPLNDDPVATSALAYVRMPGPAGHRSRYDDTAIEQIAAHCAGSKADVVFCCFRNIDMYANSRSLLDALKKRGAPKPAAARPAARGSKGA